MSVTLSEFARNITVETAFNVLAKAKQLAAGGKQIIELEIGDSPFATTTAAKQAGLEAITGDRSHYCPSAGLPELRQAAGARGAAVGRQWGRTTDPLRSPTAASTASSNVMRILLLVLLGPALFSAHARAQCPGPPMPWCTFYPHGNECPSTLCSPLPFGEANTPTTHQNVKYQLFVPASFFPRGQTQATQREKSGASSSDGRWLGRGVNDGSRGGQGGGGHGGTSAGLGRRRAGGAGGWVAG